MAQAFRVGPFSAALGWPHANGVSPCRQTNAGKGMPRHCRQVELTELVLTPLMRI